MKPKKFDKKLVLNKMTVSNLTLLEMQTVLAGQIAVESEKTDLCHSVCNSDCKNCYTVNMTCKGMGC